jgi:hypothetical protein
MIVEESTLQMRNSEFKPQPYLKKKK